MTIKDIAHLARVSISTVSRSLNDSPLVAEETKRRVKAIAESHGFEFHAGARGMITRQVGTIGLILPDDFDRFHTQLYHSSLHNDLRRVLERAGLDLIVGFAKNRFDGSDSVLRMVRRGKVDGLIIMSPSLERKTEDFLKEQGTPYVYSHYPAEPGRTDVDWVYVDHERGGMLAGEHFFCCRRRSVVVLGDPDQAFEFRQRYVGLQKAFRLADWEVETRLLRGDCALEAGFRLVEDNLDEVRRAQSVFGLNDLVAIGAIQALAAAGLRVPEDIAVVGYDDTPLAANMHPSLTTVRQPSEDVAFMTCERLIEMIEDRAQGKVHRPKHISLQPQLVVRSSSRPCGC